MVIREETVTLTASDGFVLDAFVAHAEAPGKGGLVILQEIFGVTDQLKSVARAYAADRFSTIIPALFDRQSPKTVVPFEKHEEGRALMMKLDNEKVMLDVEAARRLVEHQRGVSVLGFCWGGGQALRAAGRLDLTSAVSFYGTRIPNYLSTPPKCPMLFHFGETDSFSPPEVIEAVRTTVPDAEIHVYKAGHAFANDARATYVPEAAVPARERTLAFLLRHHG